MHDTRTAAGAELAALRVESVVSSALSAPTCALRASFTAVCQRTTTSVSVRDIVPLNERCVYVYVQRRRNSIVRVC